jgi:hypothetical protein
MCSLYTLFSIGFTFFQTTTSNDFEYNLLPAGSIRLVQLDLGPSRHISLKLGVYDLKSAPPFTALSYSWVREVRYQSVLLQGATLCITQDLLSFLREAKCRIENFSADSARNETYWNGGWLWVDSTCADQSNTGKKNVQVAMMKKIYESAQTIISWLWVATDNVKLGSELILDFDHFREPRLPTQQSKFSSEIMPEDEWKALLSQALMLLRKLHQEVAGGGPRPYKKSRHLKHPTIPLFGVGLTRTALIHLQKLLSF